MNYEEILLNGKRLRFRVVDLIRGKQQVPLFIIEFCVANHISDTAFRQWLKQYDQNGLAGLARADAKFKEVFPEGVEPSEEFYKREIMKLRIENERLKKNYTVQTNEAGEPEYIRLKPKNLK